MHSSWQLADDPQIDVEPSVASTAPPLRSAATTEKISSTTSATERVRQDGHRSSPSHCHYCGSRQHRQVHHRPPQHLGCGCGDQIAQSRRQRSDTGEPRSPSLPHALTPQFLALTLGSRLPLVRGHGRCCEVEAIGFCHRSVNVHILSIDIDPHSRNPQLRQNRSGHGPSDHLGGGGEGDAGAHSHGQRHRRRTALGITGGFDVDAAGTDTVDRVDGYAHN